MNRIVFVVLASSLLIGTTTGHAQNPSPNQSSGMGLQYVQGLHIKGKQALKMGDTQNATKAGLLLLQGNTDKTSWNYGNMVYEANQLLGLAALREGKVAQAKKYLLAAGKTPGSPQLNSFGPEMTLAQELLKKGEKQAVLSFLDEVAVFWATQKTGKTKIQNQLMTEHAARLQQWKAEIRAGKQPTLNRVR
jgi:hypothetical protein